MRLTVKNSSKWYFLDETWNEVGPFASKEEAEEACRKYAEELDSGIIKEHLDSPNEEFYIPMTQVQKLVDVMQGVVIQEFINPRTKIAAALKDFETWKANHL